MNPGMAMLINAAFEAVAVGLTRESVIAKAQELEAKGATPEQIAVALRDMRDQAIAEAQEKINRA